MGVSDSDKKVVKIESKKEETKGQVIKQNIGISALLT